VNVLLTGFTGNVGFAIAESLVEMRVFALMRNPVNAGELPHVTLVRGSLSDLPHSLAPEIDVIVHAAADTSFRSPLDILRETNVGGTRALLEYAEHCPRLQRFVHLSTTCVNGTTRGFIAESPMNDMPCFVNPYEQSKWEAEQFVLSSTLPAEILRLSIVVGREQNGSVRRLGALHHSVCWLLRGLIPMIPGSELSRVDLVSADFVARVLRALLAASPRRGRIVHAAAGESAPTLGDLLQLVFSLFERHHEGWARGAVERPVFADAETWNLFAAAAERSGDALFARVIGDAQSFLPALLHPRAYAISLAQDVHHADWRVVVERTVEWLIRTDWKRANE
jgi:nucleoside-diphosphate-sugar epimerase